MPDCELKSKRDCVQLKKSSEASSSSSSSSSTSSSSSSTVVVELVLPTTSPTNNNSTCLTNEQRKLFSSSISSGKNQAPVVASNISSSGAGCGGGAGSSRSGDQQEGVKSTSLFPPTPANYQININNNHEESSKESNSSSGERGKICTKMFTCRVILIVLLVKCLILSFIIPAHLIPTGSEYPAPDYDHHHDGDSHGDEEDGFDNNILLDDEPLPLTLKNEIINLVDRFDIPSQSATLHPVDGNNGHGVEEPDTSPTAEDANATGENGENGESGSDNGNGVEEQPDGSEAGGDSDNDSESNAGSTDGNGNGNGSNDNGDQNNGDDAGETTQGEDAGDAGEAASSASGSENGGNGNGDSSCSSHSNGNGDATMQAVLDKIESLMDAVKNIDTSIDKMETLVQSTMIDERVYKCMSAVTNGNQTQALKYWKQILRYLSTPQKQAAILNQLIRDSYGGSEDQILHVIQFIEQTQQYYGFHTLFKELEKYNHLYRNTAVFTLGHHIKKACGRDSALYKSLPSAVQSVFADFFTLQNKHNKGYLYYAKRCVAKHYFHCLDVLTKRIDPYVLDGLADDSEEKKRYHWKLNATDTTVTKFYILNHDQYWTYRLQDLTNSPRFKMEEVGSNADIQLAHFQLKLNTDDEIMIQVRDSDDYLEEEDFKSDKAEVRLHSFHQADGIPDSPRMFWLVNPVTSGAAAEEQSEPESCNIELSSMASSNGNGNGNSK